MKKFVDRMFAFVYVRAENILQSYFEFLFLSVVPASLGIFEGLN